ncbi:MAG: alanine--tRNA ligase [Bacilli bacterium]|nr:alanine--tRNA ligase [Bacilli bacterium]
MKKLTGAEIRKTWIAFFESKGHKHMDGVSLIPEGDKSILWVNAGVTGLKKYFDGSLIPPCRRIVNVQKSIRTNDIENVGHTARHHTFFEMLGNFSIGDYFRKEVIAWAVEILSSPEWFDIPLEKLYMTYNPSDKETYQYWQDNGVSKDHLIPLEGNYWQIGEGPCGPNTEVFFDRGEKYDPEHRGIDMLKNDEENDRYIEIWGIVFSQYNAVNGVKREDYKELPSKNIDTGAGLERIACVLQGTETNFETDLFMPIIKAIEKIAKNPFEGTAKLSYRVIADHARVLTFALSDGAYFSNEGRGYVLRRIIRRAMRYAQKIGIEGTFMWKLVPVVVENYKDFYPYLTQHMDIVAKMIKGEEEKFLKTLSSGEALLKTMIEGKDTLDGASTFKLYDTYGFPPDMTREICEESGVKCDMEGFQSYMEEQRERARNARGDIESFHKQSKDLLAFKDASEFVYEDVDMKAKVIGLFVDGVKVDSIDEEGDVAFDKTTFYAESGGQVSDTGLIESETCQAEVSHVSKAPSGQHLHHVNLAYGSIKVGDELTLKIDHKKRNLTMRNHSATHLLHAALCEVLGTHVDQKGAFYNESYLRFDFPSMNKLTKEQLSMIEAKVNGWIMDAIPEVTEVLPIEEAKKLGAEMEFSEKYGDTVRVVCFGDVSKEFCGGTHVANTRDIGLFVIESEEAIASGVRRIQCLTSKGAYEYLSNKAGLVASVEEKLGGVSDSDVLSRIGSMQEEIVAKKKELAALKDKMNAASAKSIESEIVDKNGVKLLVKYVAGASRNDIVSMGDNLKGKLTDYAIVVIGGENGALPVSVFLGGTATKKSKAGDIVKKLGSIMGGSGGGRPEMASGQLKDLTKFEEAKKAVEEIFGE